MFGGLELTAGRSVSQALNVLQDSENPEEGGRRSVMVLTGSVIRQS